jgi:hypothetical protein
LSTVPREPSQELEREVLEVFELISAPGTWSHTRLTIARNKG